ncbi:C1-like protein, partial [Corchorus capsularis]
IGNAFSTTIATQKATSVLTSMKLMRFVEESDTELSCWGCFTDIYGPAYIAVHDDARMGMHKSCAELPPQIKKDAFHPHPLQFSLQAAIVCDGCGRLTKGLIGYNCIGCTFSLGFKCAMALFNDELADIQLKAAAKRIKKGIIHFSHIHPLTRCMSSTTLRTHSWVEFECRACKQKPFDTLIYVCIPCRFCLHESCLNELKPRQGVRKNLDKMNNTILLEWQEMELHNEK